jgi:hypothetical protein
VSEDEGELVLGGRYQVMPVLAVRAHVEAPELSLVFLDLWDSSTRAVASVRLVPDEARELARRLQDAAHTADLVARR